MHKHTRVHVHLSTSSSCPLPYTHTHRLSAVLPPPLLYTCALGIRPPDQLRPNSDHSPATPPHYSPHSRPLVSVSQHAAVVSSETFAPAALEAEATRLKSENVALEKKVRAGPPMLAYAFEFIGREAGD